MTPNLAAEMLERYSFDRQRQKSKSHVEFLAHEMKAGRFVPEAMYLVHCQGAITLTDGYHRLEGIIQSDTPQMVPVVHIWDNHQDAVTSDYIRRDRGRMRTLTHIYNAANLCEDTNLSLTQVGWTGAAARIIGSGFTQSAKHRSSEFRSGDLQQLAVLDWAPEALEYIQAFKGSESSIRDYLVRAAVMAIALVTFRYQRERAVEFWSRLAADDGLKTGDPEKTLLSWLRAHRIDLDHPSHIYCRSVAQPWNSFFAGRKKGTIYVAKSELTCPITIAGTPYDGKKVLVTSYDEVTR